jgi:hypothetical protein
VYRFRGVGLMLASLGAADLGVGSPVGLLCTPDGEDDEVEGGIPRPRPRPRPRPGSPGISAGWECVVGLMEAGGESVGECVVGEAE